MALFLFSGIEMFQSSNDAKSMSCWFSILQRDIFMCAVVTNIVVAHELLMFKLFLDVYREMNSDVFSRNSQCLAQNRNFEKSKEMFV